MKAIRISFTVLFVFLILFCTSCTNGSYTTVQSVKNNTPTSAEMSYKDFNGEIYKNIVVAQGETCEVSFQITSDSGKLDLSLTGQDGSQNYIGSSVPTSNFTVTLDKAQNYTLSIHGDHHSGSYKITWNKK